MSIEENKALIRRWVAARNSNDLEAGLALWVDEMHERLLHGFNQFTEAFPDLHVTIEEMIAEGDKIVVRWTMTGTHRGVWRGIPPTGNPVTWNVTDIYTVSGGKLASNVRAADSLALLKQLGVTVAWQDIIVQ